MAERGDKPDALPLNEDSLIARYFAPLAASFPGAAGLKDDAAAFAPPPGTDLVVTTDALVADVHFFADDDPADIAFKALAVNVSDLAAKAAQPIAYSLALVLPRGMPETWIAGFAEGLAQAQEAFGIGLSGGDTTASPAGPLMLSVTAFGHVPAGRMIPRGGARVGDSLYVSGTIGDAALGLKLRAGSPDTQGWPLDDAGRGFLTARYLRPEPRLALRDALLGHASAAMDVSDGLAIDCGRMCKASGVSASIEAGEVPLSATASALLEGGAARLEDLLSGGDDYEILAAIPRGEEDAFERSAEVAGVPVTRIGHASGDGDGLVILGADGAPLALSRLGYDHLTG
ncbi:MAG: thiamine-phosphate kinase [Rhodomicrobiaceae bacterium]